MWLLIHVTHICKMEEIQNTNSHNNAKRSAETLYTLIQIHDVYDVSTDLRPDLKHFETCCGN